MMNRKLEFALILCAVVAACSAASHAAIRFLKIRATHGGYHHYGPKEQKALSILHGSSLAYDGLDWGEISEALGGAIVSWATPGSSPPEWEVQHRRSPGVTRTWVVISPYDLNEYLLCDFRADIVPLTQALRDLWRTDADWQFCKRIISQYPMMVVRKIFPTVGRSDGVMTGVRDWLQKLVQGQSSVDSGDVRKFGSTGASEVKERLSDWPPSRLQRRLVLMRSACQGRHTFNGPKKLALTRLLQQARHHGAVTCVVMPVSPIYQKEFLTPKVRQDFEAVLAELQQQSPRAMLIRLDQLPEFQDNALFSDFVHLNSYGQQIATAAFLSQLKKPAGQP